MGGSLLVVTGPPGAGKSTVSQIIADGMASSVLMKGDVFFDFVVSGFIKPWLPESHRQNEVITEAAAASTACFVTGGYDCVYDGVVGPWFLAQFLEWTGLDELNYVVLLPALEVCLHRVATRVGHGFKNGPAATKMHEEFAKADVESRHVLNAPDDDPADVAATIMSATAAGRFCYRA